MDLITCIGMATITANVGVLVALSKRNLLDTKTHNFYQDNINLLNHSFSIEHGRYVCTIKSSIKESEEVIYLPFVYNKTKVTIETARSHLPLSTGWHPYKFVTVVLK